MQRRRLLVGLAVVLAVVGLGLHLLTGEDADQASERPETIQAGLTETGWAVEDLSRYTVQEYSQEPVSGISSARMVARQDGVVVRTTLLTEITNATASAYMDMQRSDIGDRFRKTPEPYAASPTPEVRCDDSFLPVYEDHPDGVIITNMSASSTRSFPTCDREAVTHQVTVRLLHCSSTRSFVRMTTYTPVGQDEPSFSISCPS